MDSPLGGNGFELQFRDSSLPPTACGRLHSAVSGDSSIRRDSSTGLPTPAHCSDDTAAPTVDRRSSDEPTKPFPIYAELNVRIHSAPAESQVRTCLSREFAFLRREAAVFRGSLGRDERPGWAETRGRGNIWP